LTGVRPTWYLFQMFKGATASINWRISSGINQWGF